MRRLFGITKPIPFDLIDVFPKVLDEEFYSQPENKLNPVEQDLIYHYFSKVTKIFQEIILQGYTVLVLEQHFLKQIAF